MNALPIFYSLSDGHVVVLPFTGFPHYSITPLPITYNPQYFPLEQVQLWQNEPQNQEFKDKPYAGQSSRSTPKN
jgi:hypothetical protein